MAIKKMRGIAVFDMEIDGDYEEVGKVEKALKEWAEKFIEDYSHVQQEKRIASLKIDGHQAALTDRRGTKTGPIDKIVFRN